MSKSLKTIIWIVVIALIVWGIYSISTKNRVSTDEPIKIGFIGPLTGDAGFLGSDELNAVNLALEKLEGKINDREVEIIPEDGKCSGKDAATAAQKLVNVDNVSIILGGICSSETLGAAPITEKEKVILHSAFSSSPDISDAGEYIFRSVMSDIEIARPLLPKIAEHKKLAMITENTDYSQGIRKDFIPELEQMGVEIVADEVFAPKEKDFKTHLAKIKSADPDALFINVGTGPTPAKTIIKQIGELGIDVQIYGNYIIGSGDILDNAETILEGAIFFDAPILDPDNSQAQEFISEYKEKYGEPYSEWEVAARYDSVFIIKNAIESCGRMNTSCIKRYLYNMEPYEGTVGTYNFDEKGDNTSVKGQLYKIENGNRVMIQS